MNLEVLFPRSDANVTVREVLDALARVPTDGQLTVGDQRVIDFLVDLSGRLLTPLTMRRHPELGSLGFFLRRSALTRLVEELRDGARGRRAVRRGMILHFPPSNVDTIFVYSWALAALAGNSNVIRLSGRAGGAAQAVLDALDEALAGSHVAISQSQRIVRYERDDAITRELSAACDVRVVWGGERSIQDLRRFPVAPLAREAVFPDRSSFAIISVDGWGAASSEERDAAVDGFANDVYWFDQAACSSPRALIWVGETEPPATHLDSFGRHLEAAVARRGWRIDPAMAVAKRVSAYRLAASGLASSVSFRGNEVAEIKLGSLASLPREWMGAGTVCHAFAPSLADLALLLERKDQTISHFGFTQAELEAFVSSIAGRGVDRIVPFGQALAFADVWDGLDLMHEFTRIVTVRS